MRALWGQIFLLLFLTAGTTAGSVTLVGSPSHGHAITTSLTISHANAGDYLVVAVYNGFYPEATAVTYNGVSMTRLNTAGPIGNTEIVIFFGLAAPDSGTHDVVVTDGGNTRNFYVIAQSCSGVHQTRPFRQGGGDYAAFLTAPFTYTVPSETGWMVLDALWTDQNYGGGIAPSGVNELVVIDTNGHGIGMSFAPGAATVTMEWTWPNPLSFVYSVVQLRPATDDTPDVALDNAGAPSYAASTTTVDASVTVGAGTNRALTAALVFDNKSVSGVSVVYDPAGANQSLSLIKSEVTPGSWGRVELWGLLAPATGTNKTLRVSWTGSSDIEFAGASWTNVDNFARAASNTGTTTPTTLQLTSGVHNVTVDCAVAADGYTDTKWAEQVILFGPAYLSNIGTGAISNYQPGSTSGFHWLNGQQGTSNWAIAGSDIVVVGCTPPATPTITPGGPTTFCAGGSVTLTSSSATGNQWYLNDNPIVGATAQQYNATASGDYTVTVTAGGCTSAPSAATTVVVNPVPAIPVITAPVLAFAGETGLVASVPLHAGSSYSWGITNGTITAGATTNQITFTAGSSGTVSLTVTETNASGCSSPTANASVPIVIVQPAGLVEDAHATGGTSSNVNGVLEPGETVLVNASWKNTSATPVNLTGTASAFTGPAGATYSLLDSAADYGTIAPGATADSWSVGVASYRLSVSNPVTRPASHWDATFLETLSSLEQKTWTLHIGQSFTDVPVSDGVYRFVETLLHNLITAGCGGGNFCPASNVTRWQMAVFLATAMVGPTGTVPTSGTVPGVGSYNCTSGGNSLFGDIPPTDGGCKFIHYIYAAEITAGCGGGNYCPASNISRWQMAVFLATAMAGSGAAVPPSGTVPSVGTYNCTSGGNSLFSDVPPTDPGCRFIHYIYAGGVTAGCGGGKYCPASNVTRWQMAPFVVTAFAIPLLY